MLSMEQKLQMQTTMAIHIFKMVLKLEKGKVQFNVHQL